MYRLKTQALFRQDAYIKMDILRGYDLWVLLISMFMLLAGLVMVASASITVAAREFSDPLHYFWRQSIAASIGVIVGLIIVRIPMWVWQLVSVPLLFVGFFLLILVLIPGIGKDVNGSWRWVAIGPITLQASEPVKFCVIAYLAGYLVRHGEAVRHSFSGFFMPIVVLSLVAILLLSEPDFGATVVLFATALGMLFIGGVPLSRFAAWLMVAIASLFSLAILSPYRMQRLVSFVDPWKDPYDSSFQLTQALIAFGRGEWFGVGLGGSVQKLFYLPEAHTDFMFAIIAEEVGLVGSVIVICLFSLLVWRAFLIARTAEYAGQYFSAFFAYGVGLVIGVQAFINIGVNTGVLPTKGLTLPLMSYGSNSLIITCTLLAVLLRIEYENRRYHRSQIPDKEAIHAS